MVWYSHLFKNFLQFVVIHSVKGFSIVTEAEVDEFSCFFYDPTDIGNLICDSSGVSKSSFYTWKFSVHVLLKPILSIFLQVCEMSTIVWESEPSVALPFFGIGMKTDLFQSCGCC